MRPFPEPRLARVSPMWTAGVVVSLVVASAGIIWAVAYQRAAAAPVGEGELFKQEAVGAASEYLDLISAGTDPDLAVRTIRNDLGIEAVAAVGTDGRVVASSAPELTGRGLAPLLADALTSGRFAAQAVAIDHPLSIDGVTEWTPGSVLYEVVEPLAGGGGVLLSYDISELLARRSQSTAIRPLTVQLGVASFVAAAIGIGLWFARTKARDRMRQARHEAELLAARSRDLERHNRELDAARREAERALAMAEETNRVRSEFVLMINHELRTPLTSVVTGTEMLLDQPDMQASERMELLGHIARDGRRLIELMGQILTVARVENRSLEFTLTPLPIDRVLSQLSSRWDWLDVKTGDSTLIETDRDTLTQIIHSLADNARNHGATRVEVSVTRDLPFTPHLTVGSAPVDPVYFLVTDNGPGIDHEFLPRAFEKFEKRGFASGTGLGLYLVRLMADAIDGSLVVHTTPAGTTIAVAVPASVQALEEV